jgi:homoserine O-acetyltransferase/O-succinyltransferase
MKIRKIALLLVLQLAVATMFAQNNDDKSPVSDQKPKPQGERHEFVIPNFKTESGVTLPKAIVVYGTYGHLNAAKDNLVILPSH